MPIRDKFSHDPAGAVQDRIDARQRLAAAKAGYMVVSQTTEPPGLYTRASYYAWQRKQYKREERAWELLMQAVDEAIEQSVV